MTPGTNTVEIIVRATDRASATVTRVARNMTRTLDGVAGSAARSSARMAGVTSAAFNVMGRAAGVVERAVGRIALVSVAAGAGVIAIARQALSTASQFETFNAKLTTAFKSPLVAAQKLREAMQYATETPFEVGEVVDAFVRLKFYGLDAATWMTRLGNMAGSMGKSFTDSVEAVADALSGGGLERMKEFGIGFAALKAAGAHGTVGGGIATATFDDIAALQQALVRILDERFAGGMARAMDTAAGKVSNFRDTLTRVWLALGQALQPAFRALLTAASTWATRLEAAVTRYSSRISGGALAATNKLLAAVNALIARAPQLWAQLQRAVGVLAGWAQHLPTLDQVRAKLAELLAAAQRFAAAGRQAITNLLGPNPLQTVLAFTASAGALFRDLGATMGSIFRDVAPLLRGVLQLVVDLAAKFRAWWDGASAGARKFVVGATLALLVVTRFGPAVALLLSPIIRLIAWLWKGAAAWRAYRAAQVAAAAVQVAAAAAPAIAAAAAVAPAAVAAAVPGTVAAIQRLLWGASAAESAVVLQQIRLWGQRSMGAAQAAGELVVVESRVAEVMARRAAAAAAQSAAAAGAAATASTGLLGAVRAVVARIVAAAVTAGAGIAAAAAPLTAACAAVGLAIWAGVQLIRQKAEEAAAESSWRAAKALEKAAGQTGAERKGYTPGFWQAAKEIYGRGGSFWRGEGRGDSRDMEITAGTYTPEGRARIAAAAAARRAARVPHLVGPPAPPGLGAGLPTAPLTPLRYATPTAPAMGFPQPPAYPRPRVRNGSLTLQGPPQIIRTPEFLVTIEPRGSYRNDLARYGGR